MDYNAFDYPYYYNKVEGGIGKREFNDFKNVSRVDSKWFTNVQGIYVLKQPAEAKYFPEFIEIDGRICRKYLNIFYLHLTLSQLTPTQVIAICEIRLENLHQVTSMDYNKFMISEIIKKATAGLEGQTTKNKILDYGIGSGISLECLHSLKLNTKFELTGTDISREALKICTHKGINTFYWGENQNIAPDSYDAIISSFVFDFNITSNEVKKLYQLLNKNGRLVLNLYKDDLINYHQVIRNLQNAGFTLTAEQISTPAQQYGIGHKVEKIIIAEKL